MKTKAVTRALAIKQAGKWTPAQASGHQRTTQPLAPPAAGRKPTTEHPSSIRARTRFKAFCRPSAGMCLRRIRTPQKANHGATAASIRGRSDPQGSAGISRAAKRQVAKEREGGNGGVYGRQPKEGCATICATFALATSCLLNPGAKCISGPSNKGGMRMTCDDVKRP